MIVRKSESIPIVVEDDIVRARLLTRQWAIELGFKLIDQTKMVTAVSELARNTFIHGRGGFMLLQTLEHNFRKGLRAIFEDKGPGIADIEQALKDGFTTAKSLGLGLGGAKRLSNEFEIFSQPGQGTRVAIARWI